MYLERTSSIMKWRIPVQLGELKNFYESNVKKHLEMLCNELIDFHDWAWKPTGLIAYRL